MKKAERAAIVLAELEKLYPQPPIPLDFTDAYTLLIATLLSAQCTDIRVNQITPLLFAKARTPQEMVQLSEAEILEIVRPCGLGPQKAKGIWGLSHQILQLHGGEVPSDLKALEALPGVGHKTASVVQCQAFGMPTFPVDTHIHRLAKFWKLTQGKNVAQTERDLRKCFPKQTWAKLHLQIIHYGRDYVTARAKDPQRICRIWQKCFPAK